MGRHIGNLPNQQNGAIEYIDTDNFSSYKFVVQNTLIGAINFSMKDFSAENKVGIVANMTINGTLYTSEPIKINELDVFKAFYDACYNKIDLDSNDVIKEAKEKAQNSLWLKQILKHEIGDEKIG